MEIKTTEQIIEELNTSNSFSIKKYWVSFHDIIKKLEEHKNCQEYHKIPSKDDPNQYYKESCLLKIWTELQDELKRKENGN
jgi:hypothetical protein